MSPAAVTVPSVTGATRYILDANVLINAGRNWYRFTFCSGFWKVLLDRHNSGVVTSIDHVKSEIKPGDDLHNWAKNIAPKALWQSSKNATVGQAYADIMAWASTNPQYKPTAIAELASVADGWIVAFAKVHGLVVVTHEVHDNGSARVKIPSMCKAFSVPHCTTFAMLQDFKIDLKWP
jgi:hypothetical protein